MELLRDVGHVKSRFGPFGDSVNVSADKCMVCAKHTIGSEIILDAPDGTLGDEAQVDARFILFGDSANLDARQVHDLRQTYHRLKSHFGRTRWIS
jgi:hypothetical protein